MINGAVGLSGFARRPDGTDLVFSILVNGYTRGDPDAMAAIDAFATALVR
jgi:D-alanyl-D-alanine carboxypeptidase